jgi:hypothetical protein
VVRGREPSRRRDSRRCGEGKKQAASVLFRGTHEHVQIAGESRRPMKRQRVRADDHEINRVRGQQRAELVEVWRQIH